MAAIILSPSSMLSNFSLWYKPPSIEATIKTEFETTFHSKVFNNFTVLLTLNHLLGFVSITAPSVLNNAGI